MNRIILFSILIVSIIACNSNQNKEYLPRATGKPGDMFVIMDSTQWKDSLGRAVRKIFEAPVPGLPQDEPMFTVVFIHPSKGTTMLTQLRNLVYVFTLDQQTKGSKILHGQFSEETLNKIRNDSTFYMYTQKDEYSRGQQVMYLFSDTEEDLLEKLKAHRNSIIDFFNKSERERIQASLVGTRSTSGIADFLRKEQQCAISVPLGYKLADRREDFVWLRYMDAEIDKDIIITWKPYESEYQMLPDSIIAWRNQVARKYLFEDPKNPISYLVTEQEDALVHAKQVNLNGHFAMELRGLWRTNNRTMGGAFIGYSLIDEPKGRLYYIEGFAYAPGRDKREIIRELEAILWTFKTSEQIAGK